MEGFCAEHRPENNMKPVTLSLQIRWERAWYLVVPHSFRMFSKVEATPRITVLNTLLHKCFG